jgi:small-conductance mechanosensitive channel
VGADTAVMSMPDYLARLLADRVWISRGLALLILLGGAAMLVGVRAVVRRRLAKIAPLTKNRWDDVLADLVGRTSVAFLLAVAGLIAIAVADVGPSTERLVRAAALVVCLVQAGIWGSRGLRELIERRFEKAAGVSEDPTRQTVARMAALAARVGLWALLLLVALDNMGVDITALIAGLGVGGVAVALATQNILGDLFASVSILLDKPFVPGDFVIVGDFKGTIEHIGIKTTRVRSLGGEQLVFANNDLLQSRLRNYKRMTERRIQFGLGIVYQTPFEKLEAIPTMVRAIVEGQPGTRFDRAHFVAFGDFALQIEVVYYVLDPDYNKYMDVQQAINLGICRTFADENIEFAYPTQTLLVQRGSAANGADRTSERGWTSA